MEERWLPVVGFGGFYEVSDLGNVRSVDRIVQRKGRDMRLRGRPLRAGINSCGYRTACLHRRGKLTTQSVHVLVAEAFIGPRPEGLDVLHGPGGQLDNRVTNLRYGTVSENMADTVRDGTNWWRDQEDCLRGHRLAPPNLMLARLPHRGCLACNRGHGTVRHAARRGVALDLKTEADRHYRAIMASSSATQ